MTGCHNVFMSQNKGFVVLGNPLFSCLLLHTCQVNMITKYSFGLSVIVLHISKKNNWLRHGISSRISTRTALDNAFQENGQWLYE